MTAILLDGRTTAKKLLRSLEADVRKFDPKLIVVQVGNDPASTSYIAQKIKSCDAVGMRHDHRHLPEDTNLDGLLKVVDSLNNDDDVSGFIVQLPLPNHLQKFVPQILRQIDPMKDVDGFTAYNLGKVFLSKEYEHLPPATPAGIILLLEKYGVTFEGKNVTIVGHSNTVGKPLSTMLLNRNATVTTCHVHTKDLKTHTLTADILCVAVGKPGLITADMVKEGAVVVDIGITKTRNGITGDVDFDAVKEKAAAISPVPGGVGPMTVASLVRNCVNAKKRQLKT
jgi:methylenetetrahydrofolate dehydrogenase (NADP+) / methenyltetrahydrofolate cyclohydrolase